MKLYALGTALRNLGRAPLRSILTSLGVIVGVTAVVATVSIGSGAKARVEEMLATPTSRAVIVAATVPGTRDAKKLPRQDRLVDKDYHGLHRLPSLSAASPRFFLNGVKTQAGARKEETLVSGVDVDGLALLTRPLREGSNFGTSDVKRAASVCLVSEWLANKLFPGESAIGGIVILNGASFRVVGTMGMEETGVVHLDGTDANVVVPYTTLLRRLDPKAEMYIYLQARSPADVQSVQRNASEYMERHRNGRRADFLFNNNVQSVLDYSSGSETMAKLIAAVGAIALIVGGIGIMNIMLVSVTERTREIGLRMAIGTRERSILLQFLSEAVVLSLSGGVLGILLGAAASSLVTQWNGWPTELTVGGILVAVSSSLAVGVFFGYFPARRAARLDPATSLRLE
jgi:putative ABC transport system permease protein